MKKKISLLLLVFVLALSFVGCSSQKSSSLEYDEATLENYSEMLIQSFSQMSDNDFEYFNDLSDYSLSYTLMNSGLPVSNEDFLAMTDGWQKAVSEYGAYVEHGDYTVDATDKDITIKTKAVFENSNATELTFVFDEKLNMTSMTVDVQYTMGQILEKAGLNTLLGMGTVFAVLIFISLLIYLFKFFPALEAKFKNKGKSQAETPAKVQKTPVVTGKANTADDSQLVAVITAAIAAAEGNSSTGGFIVRSIKRRKTNKWN